MAISITYFFRKPVKGFYSIEELFDSIKENLPEQIAVKSHIQKFKNQGFLRRFFSGIIAMLNQSDINHISGDIHYFAIFLNKKKTILTIHDLVPLTRGSTLKRKIIKYIWYTLPSKYATHITAISETTKQELLKTLNINPDKISVIPNCYNKRFQYKQKEFNKDNPILLVIGTFSNKNIERIFKAVEKLNCTLNIIGQLTQEQVDLLEKHEIKYTNNYNLHFEEVIKSYINCDMLVFPSLYEGFGMPIIEAQATGRPVITSNLNPMKEIAGESAYLVNPYNIEEIRNAIIKLCVDDSIRNKLITKGLENIKRFEPKTIANSYLGLYNSIYKQYKIES